MDGQLGKILIVDDDENICEVIKMYLQSSNYDTKVVNNGKIAEEVFLDYKPDLVLLDVMLPGVDGIDVLKWIRKEKETPVIMLTARGETFDKVLALELGADDYVVKPFEPKELVARVKAVMRRYNADTAEYIKEQYKNMKSNLCAKRKCDDCFIHDINRAKCYDMFCFQIYVGLNLLKEV